MQSITPDTPLRDIINGRPELIVVLERYGLECAGCIGKEYETLKDIALIHNLSIETLVEELNSGRYGH